MLIDPDKIPVASSSTASRDLQLRLRPIHMGDAMVARYASKSLRPHHGLALN